MIDVNVCRVQGFLLKNIYFLVEIQDDSSLRRATGPLDTYIPYRVVTRYVWYLRALDLKMWGSPKLG